MRPDGVRYRPTGTRAPISAYSASPSTTTPSSIGRRSNSTSNFVWKRRQKGFRHFLEVFDPNQPDAVESAKIPEFINDAIVRTLGGVTAAGRPIFLKMVYHGPKAMEELVHYDPHLVVGILGGSAGTTYDAFKLLSEAKKYGARVALFGRKINNAENQLAFIHFLRLMADGEITAEEAVRAYHGVLTNLKIQPHRPLEDDMRLQTNVMSYGGDGKALSFSAESSHPAGKTCACGCSSEGSAKECAGKKKPPAKIEQGSPSPSAKIAGKKRQPGIADQPNFAAMTAAEKIAYHKARWDRVLE